MLRTGQADNRLAIRERGVGGAGRAIALPLFGWVEFLGLQMTWVFYEFYQMKVKTRLLLLMYVVKGSAKLCSGSYFRRRSHRTYHTAKDLFTRVY